MPNIAVPQWVYRGGMPGGKLSGVLPPQRVQATPDSPIPVHILCPENTTVCLWAKWSQGPLYVPHAFGSNGPITPWPDTAPVVWPLLPSVGQLTGYMQASGRSAAGENAAFGWQG